MSNTIKVLDHGFVRLLNIASAVAHFPVGADNFPVDDTDPAQAARTSFNKGMQSSSNEVDMKLVRYLIANGHNTPIEMTVIWLEMKLPIFIARQFNRHRHSAINEVSGRYLQLPAEWYIPEVVGGKPVNGAKQGQVDNLSLEIQESFKKTLGDQCSSSYIKYITALGNGVAPEHARMFLHLNHYTQEVVKLDLHNMMHFLSLRLDAHAQIEARAYAEAIYMLLQDHLPQTMALFDSYRKKLTDYEKKVLREIANNASLTLKQAAVLEKVVRRVGA